MYQTKTVMGYGYREDFDRELTNALNKIAAEGGRNLQVSNSTYSEEKPMVGADSKTPTGHVIVPL